MSGETVHLLINKRSSMENQMLADNSIHTSFGTFSLREFKYRDKSRGIQLYDSEGMYCTLTTSLDLGPQKDGEYLIKTWSENEPIAKELLKLGVFEDTGINIPTGFVSASIWRLVK